MIRMRVLVFILLITPIFFGCEGEYSPKPKAYVRLNLPEHSYIVPDSTWSCPYIFEASRYSFLTVDKRHHKENCWYNIYYPKLKATIHLTYSELNNNLSRQIEENRKLAMKHVGKATAINESLIENKEAQVFGLIYEFKGETASDMQFFATDSLNHFLRGSLYFNVKPNKDSLGPAIDYVKNDMRHFIQSLRWTQRAD